MNWNMDHTVIKFNVTNRFTGRVQFTAEIDCFEEESDSVKLGLAVKWAVKTDANLVGADLAGADLTGANLTGAGLAGANLTDANLVGADLARANLTRANLVGANLTGANLTRANLVGANLTGADLARANLTGANLTRANLTRANLVGANLTGANLMGADLTGADLEGSNLTGVKGMELAIARTRILPEGDLIGWKRCKSGVIVKLRIPEDARRSHAFGRKCRAEFVDVLEVIGAEVGISIHDGKTEYRVGQRVTCNEWCDDWQQECAGGIHFFITRLEAENY